MRDLAALTFLTLDGVMQAPAHPDEDRSGGFQHGGWAADFWEQVMKQVIAEAMIEPYDLLLGRKTYDSFASHWPNVKNDPTADKLNSATKYVAVSNSDPLVWNNSMPLSGDVPAGVRDLKSQDGPLLQIHGSWQLIQTLLANDLIDEFRLWVFPVIVGSGKRLFGHSTVPQSLSLIKSATTENGVAMKIYRRRRT